MNTEEFKKVVEEQRARLSRRGQYGSESNLYFAKNANAAVISILTVENGCAHDTCYHLYEREKDNKITIIEASPVCTVGRTWATGITNGGKKFIFKHQCDNRFCVHTVCGAFTYQEIDLAPGAE